MKQRSGKLWEKCKQIAAYVMMFAMMTSLMPAAVVKADELDDTEYDTGLYFVCWDNDSQDKMVTNLNAFWNTDIPDYFSTNWMFVKKDDSGTTYQQVDMNDIEVTYYNGIADEDELRNGISEAVFTKLTEGQMEQYQPSTQDYEDWAVKEISGGDFVSGNIPISYYEIAKSGTYKFTYNDGQKEYSSYLFMTHRAWDFYETDEITDNPLREYYYQEITDNTAFYLKQADENLKLGKLTYEDVKDEEGNVTKVVKLDENNNPVLDESSPVVAGIFEWNDATGRDEIQGDQDYSKCISYDPDTGRIVIMKDPDNGQKKYAIKVYFYGKTDPDENGEVEYWSDSTEVWIHKGFDYRDSVWVGFDEHNGKVEWNLTGDDKERESLQAYCNVKGNKDGVYDIYLTEKPNYPNDFDWENAGDEERDQYGRREGAEPVVKIVNDDKPDTIITYTVNNDNEDYRIDDCGDEDNKTWHFTYKYCAYDGINIYWSAYDAFEYDETEQFQIQMKPVSEQDQGTITLDPLPDLGNRFEDSQYGTRYNYSVDQIGKVSVIFTPENGYVLHRIYIGDTSYINEDYKEDDDTDPTFKADKDGSYTYTFSDTELMRYYEEDGNKVPDKDKNGNQRYESIHVDADFVKKPVANGFSWGASGELASKVINKVSYKINNDEQWTDISEAELNELYFSQELEEGDTITVKIAMEEGYIVDPDRCWAAYNTDSGDEPLEHKSIQTDEAKKQLAEGLLSEGGYTFLFAPNEDYGITDNAMLNVNISVMKQYDDKCNLYVFVQSEAGKDENGDIIYGLLDDESGEYIEDTQGYPDFEFNFNENECGGCGLASQDNTGEDAIKLRWISTIPGDNKGKPVEVIPSSYVELPVGGYINGDTSNTIRISDRLIDEVYIDKNMDGTFAADELVTPNENNVYEISLGAAEKYNILIRKHASDDAKLLWTYMKDENDPEQDNLVEHGRVYVKEIKRDGNILIGDMQCDEGGNIILDNAGCPIYHTWEEQEIDARFYRSGGDITARNGDEVTLLLIPTYGYQLKSTSINGQEVAPQEEMSTFKVTLNGNLHFSSIFEKADNVTAVKAKEVSAATIADGENAADSGNLSLTVENNTKYDTDVTSAVKLGADETIQKIASLDMTLDNIVSKGSKNEYWTKNISSFEDAITVGLTLKDVTLAQGESLAVIRDHEGKLTSLDAKYDAAGKTLTFPTNQFSTYTIVKIVEKEKEPEPTPTPTPTPEHKHNLVKTEEKAATATTAGNKAYWTCSDCGKVYSDSEGTTETTVAAMTIAATGVPEKGTRLQDAKTGVSYVVTSKDGKNPTVTYSGNKNKKAKTITVPSTVTIDGVTYKVTAIADNAFKNNKKVTKVVIPSNIITIGKNAFNGCSKLKTIQIKSTKLTSKSISKNAFKGISKKVTIKVPKKKLKAYKKLFRKKGLSKKVKMKS